MNSSQGAPVYTGAALGFFFCCGRGDVAQKTKELFFDGSYKLPDIEKLKEQDNSDVNGAERCQAFEPQEVASRGRRNGKVPGPANYCSSNPAFGSACRRPRSAHFPQEQQGWDREDVALEENDLGGLRLWPRPDCQRTAVDCSTRPFPKQNPYRKVCRRESLCTARPDLASYAAIYLTVAV